jgi:hypothetical protein
MSIEFLLLSDICIGKYYKLLTFIDVIRLANIQSRKTDEKNIKLVKTLGKLLEIRKIGRPYDPDIMLLFELPDGNKISIEHIIGTPQAYIEYEPDTEEKSKERITNRNSILKMEIECNNWAFRPENVVATQGIDLTLWV